MVVGNNGRFGVLFAINRSAINSERYIIAFLNILHALTDLPLISLSAAIKSFFVEYFSSPNFSMIGMLEMKTKQSSAILDWWRCWEDFAQFWLINDLTTR